MGWYGDCYGVAGAEISADGKLQRIGDIMIEDNERRWSDSDGRNISWVQTGKDIVSCFNNLFSGRDQGYREWS